MLEPRRERVSRLFLPAARMLNRLSFLPKFTLIGLICLVPVAVSAYLFISDVERRIGTTEKEAAAIEPLRLLARLQVEIEAHRAVVSERTDRTAAGDSKLETQTERVDQALAALYAWNKQNGVEFGTDRWWKTLSEDWYRAKRELSKTDAPAPEPARTTSVHDKLTADVREWRARVAEETGLSLDDAPDVNRLWELSKRLGEDADRAGRLSSAVIGMSAAGRADATELAKLAGDLSFEAMTLVQDSFARIRNPGLKASIADALRRYQGGNTTLIDGVQYRLKAGEAPPSELVAAAGEANDSAALLLGKVDEALAAALNLKLADDRRQLGLLIAVVAVFGLAAAYLFLSLVSSIRRTVTLLAGTSARLAAGDLTARVPLETKDELRLACESVNGIALSLAGMIAGQTEVSERMKRSARSLETDASRLSEGSRHSIASSRIIREGADVQLRGAERATRETGEMAAGIRAIAQRAEVAAETAAAAAAEASSGRTAIGRSILQLDEARIAVRELEAALEGLLGHADRIGERIADIQAIATQTSILAINATIEAAHAGVHGRGFAVVAERVRELSRHTGQSARSIVEGIESIRRSAIATGHRLQEGVRELDRGMAEAERTGTQFQEITQAVEYLSGMVSEIAATCAQSAESGVRVSNTLEEMLRIAREAAARAEQIASDTASQEATVQANGERSRELSELSERLRAGMDGFKLGEAIRIVR